jgi:beta-glucosidase
MAASILSTFLAGSALLNAVNAQNFGGSGRDEDAFSYIQPLNTTILTEYGTSPAVFPSRKFVLSTPLEASVAVVSSL